MLPNKKFKKSKHTEKINKKALKVSNNPSSGAKYHNITQNLKFKTFNFGFQISNKQNILPNTCRSSDHYFFKRLFVLNLNLGELILNLIWRVIYILYFSNSRGYDLRHTI